MAKRKRDAMPGGAPLTRRKARRAKAPKAKRPKTPKAKKPCKYGPRDADGRCPKKPSRYGAGLAGSVLGAKVAQKGKRSKTVGEHIASSVEKTAKAGAGSIANAAADRLADKYEREGVTGVVKTLKSAAKVLVIPALVASLWATANAIQRQKAARFATRELERTAKALKRPLSQVEAETLAAQYVAYVKSQWTLAQDTENKNPAIAARALAALRFIKSL